jgi:hypothetical protein
MPIKVSQLTELTVIDGTVVVPVIDNGTLTPISKKATLLNVADFILQGSINSIVDAYKRKKSVTYQINLELNNIETNEIVWIGEKKISKLVKN